jgi:hypothetical protein
MTFRSSSRLSIRIASCCAAAVAMLGVAAISTHLATAQTAATPQTAASQPLPSYLANFTAANG